MTEVKIRKCHLKTYQVMLLRVLLLVMLVLPVIVVQVQIWTAAYK